MSKRVCSVSGCPLLVQRGPMCAQHKQDKDRARGTSSERGYDARHREWRERILARDPWCACGCGQRSTVADHITPIRQGGARFDMRNGQGMAETCHNRKRQRESEEARGRGGVG